MDYSHGTIKNNLDYYKCIHIELLHNDILDSYTLICTCSSGPLHLASLPLIGHSVTTEANSTHHAYTEMYTPLPTINVACIYMYIDVVSHTSCAVNVYTCIYTCIYII